MNDSSEVPKGPPQQATVGVAFFTPSSLVNRNEIVPELVARLTDSLRELYEERAGIMEFDAGLTRDHAECLALLNIYRDYPLGVLGVVALSLSATEYVLTTTSVDLKAIGLDAKERSPLDQVVAGLGGVVRITAYK